MNWATMTPAQRNALVAEHITGWTARPCDLALHQGLEMIYYDNGYAECPRCFVSEHITDFKHGIIPPPHYSEDMNAAWDALKHAALGSPGHLADRAVLIDELLFPFDACGTIEVYLLLGILCAWTPEKICLAILKAYGVETQP